MLDMPNSMLLKSYEESIKPVIHLKKVDSIKLTESPQGKIHLEGNDIKLQAIESGKFPFIGKIYSQGIAYEFNDTLNVVQPDFCIENLNYYFLIKGRDNNLRINVPGFNSSEIELTHNEELIPFIHNTVFNVNPKELGKFVIKIWVNHNGTKNIFGSQEFRVIDENITIKQLYGY